MAPEWGGCGGQICASRMSYILLLFFNIALTCQPDSGPHARVMGHPRVPATDYPAHRNDVVHRASKSRSSKGLSYVHSRHADR